MEPLSTLTIVLITVPSLVSAYIIGRDFYQAFTAKHIRLTRRDTGESIVISSDYQKGQIDKLIEFLKDSK